MIPVTAEDPASMLQLWNRGDAAFCLGQPHGTSLAGLTYSFGRDPHIPRHDLLQLTPTGHRRLPSLLPCRPRFQHSSRLSPDWPSCLQVCITVSARLASATLLSSNRLHDRPWGVHTANSSSTTPTSHQVCQYGLLMANPCACCPCCCWWWWTAAPPP